MLQHAPQGPLFGGQVPPLNTCALAGVLRVFIALCAVRLGMACVKMYKSV
jgi:hypothetical protein